MQKEGPNSRDHFTDLSRIIGLSSERVFFLGIFYATNKLGKRIKVTIRVSSNLPFTAFYKWKSGLNNELKTLNYIRACIPLFTIIVHGLNPPSPAIINKQTVEFLKLFKSCIDFLSNLVAECTPTYAQCFF